MTKSDLIERLTKETGKPLHQVTDTVEALFERMKSALKQDDRIEIRGFGPLEIEFMESTVEEILKRERL